MHVAALILGAVAGAYGTVAYFFSASTPEQQGAAVHFFVAAAVLLGGGAIADSIRKR